MNITTTYDEAMVKAMIAEAVEKEREACAKVCDELQEFGGLEPDHCAAAIRGRQ